MASVLSIPKMLHSIQNQMFLFEFVQNFWGHINYSSSSFLKLWNMSEEFFFVKADKCWDTILEIGQHITV
jgi:hypothetical protein